MKPIGYTKIGNALDKKPVQSRALYIEYVAKNHNMNIWFKQTSNLLLLDVQGQFSNN